jgi:hypothetical protein
MDFCYTRAQCDVSVCRNERMLHAANSLLTALRGLQNSLSDVRFTLEQFLSVMKEYE